MAACRIRRGSAEVGAVADSSHDSRACDGDLVVLQADPRCLALVCQDYERECNLLLAQFKTLKRLGFTQGKALVHCVLPRTGLKDKPLAQLGKIHMFPRAGIRQWTADVITLHFLSGFLFES